MTDWTIAPSGLPWPVPDPDACVICGEKPAYDVVWTSAANTELQPKEKLCDDCIDIQNGLYRRPNEQLVKVT